MDKYSKTNFKPKRWTGEETRILINALAARNNFEAPTAQVYYTRLLKDTNLKTSWNILYRKVRNLKSSFRKAEEWVASEEAKALKEKGEEEMSNYNLQLRHRCRYYYKLKDIFGGKGFKFYKKHTSKGYRRESDLDPKQLSETCGAEYEVAPYSYQEPIRLQGNFDMNFSEISDLLATRKNFQYHPEMIEYECEARKYEKEIEFLIKKQKLEFEIRMQDLEIRRMELEKNEKQKILDIQKDELIGKYRLKLKYENYINLNGTE